MPSRKWMVVVTLFWAYFFVGGTYGAFGAFFVPLLRYLQVSRAELSILPTLAIVVSYGIAPAAGWLLDRVAGRWVVSTGLVFACAGVLVSASAHSFRILMLGSVLFALGFGCTVAVVVAGTLISRWFSGGGRGLGLGIVFAGYALGSSTLLQVCGYVIRHMGWRAAYVTVSVPMLVLLIPALLVLSNPPQEESQNQGRGTSGRPGADLPGLEVAEGVRARSFWFINVAMFAFSFEAGILVVHSVPHLVSLGLTSSSAVSAVSLGFLLSTVAKPTFGILADKLGAATTLAICLIGSAIGCLALMRGNLWPFYLVYVCGFALAQTPIVLFPVLAAESYGIRRYGTLWGLNTTVTVAGHLMGTISAGATFDRYGTYDPILVLCAVMTLATVILPFGCVRLGAKVATPELAEAAG